MLRNEHRYILELLDDAGAEPPLGRVAIDVDWQPAVEHAHFAAIDDGGLPPETAAPPAAIEPIWDECGAPYARGVRVTFVGDGGPGYDVGTGYFADAAREASAVLVRDGRLRVGDTFLYKVTAFAADRAPDPSDGLEVEEVTQTLPIADTPIESLLGSAVPLGAADPGDPPVFMYQEIIEETRALCRQAGDLETGGVMIGRLHRDTATPRRVFIELTAQIRAHAAEARETRLTFTPETWSAARSALALRRSDESILGWWHFHPEWCRNCDAERRRDCPLNGVFFSTEDCRLHRTMFPRAYHVALLMSDRDGAIVPSVFGWRRGVIASRGFHLVGSNALAASAHAAAEPVTTGVSERATH